MSEMVNPPIPGATKYDDGKLRFDLLEWRALSEVVAIFTYGCIKYEAHGWKYVPDGEERYDAALMRHYAARKAGEIYDQESGLPHTGHMAWNALALLSFEIPKLTSLVVRLPEALKRARELRAKREAKELAAKMEGASCRT